MLEKLPNSSKKTGDPLRSKQFRGSEQLARNIQQCAEIILSNDEGYIVAEYFDVE